MAAANVRAARSPYLLLLGVQLRSLLHSLIASRAGSRGGAGRAASVGRAAGIVSIVLLVVFGFAYYAGGLARLMVDAGLGRLVPVVAVVAGSLAGVAFAFAKTHGTLFGAKDFDLVMSLPIPRATVVASRLTGLFLAAVVTAALIMVPMYVTYALGAGGIGVAEVLMLAASVVLAPLLPVSVAVFLAVGVAAVAGRFRHANLVYIAVSLILFCLVMAGVTYVSARSGAGDDAALAGMGSAVAFMGDAVAAFYPPAGWAARGITEGAAPSFFLFAVVSFAAPLACTTIVSRFYLALNAAATSTGTARRISRAALDKRMGRARTPFWALVRKEWAVILGTPSYAFNCLFGYVLLLAAAGALAVVGVDGALSSLASGMEVPAQLEEFVRRLMAVFAPWVFAFCLAMAPSAACAVSMEGRSAWVMATLPLSPRAVLGAKLAANAIPVVACMLAADVLLVATGGLAVADALVCALVGGGLFVLAAAVGLAIDVSRPNYSWSVPAEPVKRGMPMFVSAFGAMILVFAGCGGCAWLVVNEGLDAALALDVAAGAASFAAGALVFVLSTRRARLTTDG